MTSIYSDKWTHVQVIINCLSLTATHWTEGGFSAQVWYARFMWRHEQPTRNTCFQKWYTSILLLFLCLATQLHFKSASHHCKSHFLQHFDTKKNKINKIRIWIPGTGVSMIQIIGPELGKPLSGKIWSPIVESVQNIGAFVCMPPLTVMSKINGPALVF